MSAAGLPSSNPSGAKSRLPVRLPKFSSVVRSVVGLLLLAVIFHVIFCNEVQLQLVSEGGPAWDSLTKWEQRQLAWTRGPLELWNTLRRLDAISLAGAFLLCGLLVGLGAWRWQRVLAEQGIQMPVPEVLRISLVAQFFNAFLLGTAGGDVIKAWYAARATPQKQAAAAVTVFVDRLLGTLGLLLTACFLALLHWDLVTSFRRYQAVVLTLAGMLVLAGGLLFLGFYTRLLSEEGTLARWLSRIPRGDSAVRALAACRQFGRDPLFLLQMALMSMLIAALVALTYVVLARGLGIKVHALSLSFVALAVICVAALPVTPSGLGVRENLFVWLLAAPAFPLKPGLALSLSLLGYTVTLAWSAIGGLVYLLLPERAEIAAAAEAPPN